MHKKIPVHVIRQEFISYVLSCCQQSSKSLVPEENYKNHCKSLYTRRFIKAFQSLSHAALLRFIKYLTTYQLHTTELIHKTKIPSHHVV